MLFLRLVRVTGRGEGVQGSRDFLTALLFNNALVGLDFLVGRLDFLYKILNEDGKAFAEFHELF